MAAARLADPTIVAILDTADPLAQSEWLVAAELQDDTRAGVGGPGLHVTQLVGRGSRGGRTGSQQADGEKDHQAQGSAESKFHWFQ